jgi:hypothetical protein
MIAMPAVIRRLGRFLLPMIASMLLCALPVAAVSAEVLVPAGSTWKWLHPTDGVDHAEGDEDFHRTWFLASFDDSGWKEGKDKSGPHGGFGYGDPDFDGVDIVQPEDLEHRKTAYFRLKFTTQHEYDVVELRCQRDDAIIVYLDGKEVGRDNLEEGKADAYDLFATGTVSGEDEAKPVTLRLKGKVPAGEHVLAISLHNRAEGSSDLRLAEISVRSADTDAETPVKATESGEESAE